MSWLQRGLFARRRSSSQTKDEGKLTAQQQSMRTEDSDSDTGEVLVDDVDVVFGRMSIGEVRRHEQRLQRHAERMRRQLRRVAGEHYAELMAAADSAADMSAAGAQVRGQVERLADLIAAAAQDGHDAPAEHDQSRQKARKLRGQDTPVALDKNDSPAAHMYAAAAQVRVLVDTPEQVWKALTAGQYLQAALLFQIAQAIHARLGAQSQAAAAGDAAVDPLLAFPVVERQWAAVAPFRTQIAAKAQAALSADSTDASAGTGAVCAVALLEDADAETACTLFLASRAQTLQPLLHAMCSAPETALETALVELLTQVLRILREFAQVFCVPRRDRRFASRLLATLASVCADVDLPVAPLTNEDAVLPSERPAEQRNARARRRKSSVAGRVLTSTLASERGVWQMPGSTPQPASGAFMAAKYLPAEVAQFRPQMPRILEDALQSGGDTLNEAEEDNAGVARFYGSPDALLHMLSTQAQPQLERAATHALRLWWRDTVDTVQDAAARAIDRHVATVVEATRVAAAVAQAGLAAGLPPGADPVVCDAADSGQLYAIAVEPLLLRRARELQCATTDRALGLPETFLQGAELRDVLAGHVPWRALPSGGVATLQADIRAAMDVVPPAARALAGAVAGALLAGWRDAETWWQCLSGAAVRTEAAAYAAHLAAQWAALGARLGEWTEQNVAQAHAAVEADAAAAQQHGVVEAQMPHAVALCLKGAWAACALLDVLRQIATDGPPLLRECWAAQHTEDAEDPAAELIRIRRALLEPWLVHLGSSAALSWAAHFDALYSRVPAALQADAAATRRDVVRAWREASVVAGESGPWTARYAALRRIAGASQAASPAPSAAVCSLAALLQMRVQAVAGLSVLGDARGELMRGLHAALARGMEDVVARQLSCPPRPLEWDRAQLAADARHLLPVGIVDAAAHPCLSETLAG
ncbi:hypothetical protein H4R20_005343 [Coemansia guatemalensis]|uniref:Conserved oligomeric Golgi complex subunit 1 n=1 Tax=Coemansia guatemalensis TaxID=2761395 RepID=A0A9W8LR79_9FUNG|nr:hypothetical protein H4R20_005343 [Coemansia guatemalensis]